MSRPMRLRNSLATLAALGALSALAGCTTPERTPTVVETPEVVWETTEEWVSASPLEEDERVAAVRAAHLGFRLASNLDDFSIAQVNDHFPSSAVDSDYRSLVGQLRLGATPTRYVGPPIMLPLSITELPDGGAEVTFCVADDNWEITAKQPEPSYDLSDGQPRVYTVRKDPETGKFVETDWQGLVETCDATGAPVGRFDPPVELAGKVDPESVVPRVGYEAD